MAYKNHDLKLATKRVWYAANSEKIGVEVRTRRQKMLEWLREQKAGKTCSRCPEGHPACLQFHHVDPAAKEIEVSTAARNGWGKERLSKEIAKCILLCANCHCKLHWGSEAGVV